MRILYLVLLVCLVSCTHSPSKNTTNEIIESSNINELRFYKCDYSIMDSLVIVLGSRSEFSTNFDETWAISKTDLKHPSKSDLSKVNIENIIENGRRHLSESYKHTELQFSDLSIEKIKDSLIDSENWIAIVSFKYDNKGYFQKVPVLLDGTIVLSDKE